MSMKNSNGTIGNRTRDLPVCSAAPQPTAPPHAPILKRIISKYNFKGVEWIDLTQDIYSYRILTNKVINLRIP
jgi:hypothetical protein